MASLLNIGTQALSANQLALDVTGQNIANVNTDGFSRQTVLFQSGSATVRGVEVEAISRSTDVFATRQLWSSTANYSASTAFVAYANQTDDRLADNTTSISAALDNYFSALQTSIDDPSSIPSREVVISEADALAQRFQNMDSFFEQQNEDISSQVSALVAEVSQIAGQIANLNQKVTYSETRGEPTNELKDQREELVRQLSEIMGVSIQGATDDENINIFVGNGQPLVIGNSVSDMKVTAGNPDPDDLKVVVTVAGRDVEVGNEITTGEIGGLLTYRDEMLIPSWNELGRLAISFADSMNTLHQQGMDLDNELGIEMFKNLNYSGAALAFPGNESTISKNPSVQITDASALMASDYTITFTDQDDLVIKRESDGKQFKLSDFTLDDSDPINQADMTYYADPGSGSLRISLDGMTINLETKDGFIKGDKFLIKPVRNGAEEIALNLSSGRQLALASPVRAVADQDNGGYAEISDITVTDPGNVTFAAVAGELSPPVEIVFNAGEPTTFDVYDISDPDNPVPYMLTSTTPATELTGVPYTSGESIQLNGFAVTIKNQPEAGDRFTFEYSTDGISDNSNAFKLSDLQNTELVGGATYQDNYGLLVERVGTKTSVAQLNASADETVLKNAYAVRDSVAGVNLDEEAANLVRYQQAYQAAAQLISASRNLFDTLLGVTGG